MWRFYVVFYVFETYEESSTIKSKILKFLAGYAPQAEYHCETAKGYMSRGIQTSSSSTDKANIMEVNVKIYLIMGRALTNMKKYPFWPW